MPFARPRVKNISSEIPRPFLQSREHSYRISNVCVRRISRYVNHEWNLEKIPEVRWTGYREFRRRAERTMRFSIRHAGLSRLFNVKLQSQREWAGECSCAEDACSMLRLWIIISRSILYYNDILVIFPGIMKETSEEWRNRSTLVILH